MWRSIFRLHDYTYTDIAISWSLAVCLLVLNDIFRNDRSQTARPGMPDTSHIQPTAIEKPHPFGPHTRNLVLCLRSRVTPDLDGLIRFADTVKIMLAQFAIESFDDLIKPLARSHTNDGRANILRMERPSDGDFGHGNALLIRDGLDAIDDLELGWERSTSIIW